MKKLLVKTLKLFLLVSISSFLACKPVAKPQANDVAGYDLSKPEKFNMPESLLEISGIAFNNFDPSTVYAIQDEEGRLFSLQWSVKKASSVKFGPRGDYEDLAILNEQVYVLKSSGDIYSFPLDTTGGDLKKKAQKWDDFLPKAEYESIYADPQEQAIYVLTKSEGKKKRKTLGFKINVNKDTKDLGTITEFQLDQDTIKTFGYKIKSGLRVSALTRHPKTKEWYILSSAEKLLVIADPNWKVKSAHELDASIFNQPEGIAFDKDLNLYISNEGDEITNGNILKFASK